MIFEDIENYKNKLILNENKEKTANQYGKYLLEFVNNFNIQCKEDITKQKLIDFKEYLQEHYKVNTINIKLTVLNSFIKFLGLDPSYKLELLKKQEQVNIENVLSSVDYERLIRIANRKGKIRTMYILKTLAGTGIRISELKYITVEAVKRGIAVFDNKGTVERKAFINKKLKRELLKYCSENNIKSGIIFKSRYNNPLDPAYIYKEIQWIAGQARVNKKKAHPHSCRHLFAKNYIADPTHNIADLKVILGHKHLTTTEIYLKKTERELKQTMEA